jgi:UDP-N-acetyl-D-mannosaminuronic acid dehydrogenase
VTLADIGFRVKGVDTDNALCRLIRKNNPPFFEEGLPLLLAEHNGDRFTVVDNLEGENSCDVYMVAVGTPLGKNKSPQMKAVRSAAKTLGSILKPGDLIVLRSTVPLGTTRNEFIPIVEKLSGLVAGEEFFVVFAPERTVEGKALAELRTLPQVIGGINHASANMAANIFQKMTNSIHVVDSLEEAEMVKLINNTYRDVTFGFANEIALICQKWGIDANTVIDVANRGYERSHVPKPSPGVGGYCLEKDAHILMRSASAKGLYPRVIQHARESNKEILNTLAQEVYNVFRARKQKIKNPKVLIMGFAFKGRPVTSDMRGSTTIQLVERLQKVGCVNIHGYDPNVASEAIRALKVTPVTDVKKGFEGADVIVFMTNHEAFEKLDIRSLLSSTRQSPILFDTWALFSKEHVTDVNGTDYRRL